MRKRYRLEPDVPVTWIYRDDTVVATLPVTLGQSLKPIGKKQPEYLPKSTPVSNIHQLGSSHNIMSQTLTVPSQAQHDVIRRGHFQLR